jgi:DNA invertase Pin-like site-specific DNA recombinase
MAIVKVGILVRVSDPGQHTDNQLSDLLAWAERRGLEVVVTYESQESAWKGAQQKQLTQVYQDARTGKFQVLLVWALDRLSREGPLATLEIVHRLGQSGVQVWSLQEPWTEAGGDLLDLLLAIAGWVARMESNRRSERTKAGLKRRLTRGSVWEGLQEAKTARNDRGGVISLGGRIK